MTRSFARVRANTIGTLFVLVCLASVLAPQVPVALVDSSNALSEARERSQVFGSPGLASHRDDILKNSANAYGNLPLSFEANYGQVDPQVKFVSRGCGYSLLLGSSGATMRLRIADFGSRNAEWQFAVRGFPEPQSATIEKTETLRIRLVSSNAGARIVGLDTLPGKSNYFIGNDSKKWRTDVPTYSRVKFENAYPGVDVLFYGNQRQLEYDFIVAPGADFKPIRMAFDGAPRIRIDDSGDLRIHTSFGEIRQRKPLIYQVANGIKQPVNGGYVLRDEREVGFEIADYDKTRPLVIDPILAYSMRFGGSYNDPANAIAIDVVGNAYIAGTTDSLDFPTLNAFQPNLALPRVAIGIPTDVFVAKLNTSGTLVYSTYLGGGSRDEGKGIAVDEAGNAYVTGSTPSSDFPVTPGAFQTTAIAGGSAFITKLNATGSALVYSTYLGGPGNAPVFPYIASVGLGIAIDAEGSAYVTGYTFSPKFPTDKAAQPDFNKGLAFLCCFDCFLFTVPPPSTVVMDAFVTKLNPSGGGLIYSTYLGGTGQDQGYAIAVDSTGSAYVTGRTCSRDLDSTTYGGGESDAFVVKLRPSGGRFVYSKLLGGSGDDVGNAIAVDSAGSAYVAGQTDSINFPTSQQAFQPRLNGGVSYVTADGGGSWSAGSGLPNSPVNVLALDRGNPSTIYAGLGDCKLVKPAGVFKSTDGGTTWRSSLPVVIHAIAVDPKHSSIVYAGGYKSTDGGGTWSQMAANFFELKIDPVTPTTIYARTTVDFCRGDSASPPSPLLKSTDGGDTWRSVRNGPNAFFASSVAIDPASSQTLYATSSNLYKSTDGGETWRVPYEGNRGVAVLAIDPINTSTLYLKEFSGNINNLLKSTDGASTFTSLGLKGVPISDVVVDPTNTSILYAAIGTSGSGGSLLKSTDGGRTWNLTDLSGMTVTALAINPLNSSQLHAGAVADVDGFVALVNPAGGVQSTYIGTRAHDFATGIGIDASSNFYVTGRTFSDRFPTRDALQSNKTSGPSVTSAFVTKLRQGLDAIDYSTYLAGDEPSFGTGIAVNAAGKAYVTGAVGAFRPVPTSVATETVQGGGVDAFVAKITSAPRITNAEILGKNLLVIGEGFDRGALVLIDGVAQRTRSDPALATRVLIAKKAANSIALGQLVTIQVRNLDQTLSEPFVFTRPANN